MLQEDLIFELIFEQFYVLLSLVKVRTLYLNVLTVPEWQKYIWVLLDSSRTLHMDKRQVFP